MFMGGEVTWNMRDRHFLDTVKLIESHLAKRCDAVAGARPKVVLWAHNSHLGDARATDMSWRRGELNIGQLVRENWPGE